MRIIKSWNNLTVKAADFVLCYWECSVSILLIFEAKVFPNISKVTDTIYFYIVVEWEIVAKNCCGFSYFIDPWFDSLVSSLARIQCLEHKFKIK